jgi:hypothetical protein
MGKTVRKDERKKWAWINTARNFKDSHTEGNVFKSKSGTMYVVQANGSWKKVK